MRMLAHSSLPIVFTPGVIHLASVPAHRKVNRVDMGTADKVCAVALAVHDQAERLGCRERDVSFIQLELGGALRRRSPSSGGGSLTAPVERRGRSVSVAAGALDGEVAFLAGSVSKGLLFSGGVAAIAGPPDAPAAAIADPRTPRDHLAREAYLESVVKTVALLAVSAPAAREVIVSGRVARIAGVRDELARRLQGLAAGASVHTLTGFATVAKQAAQGAALVADGLAGGTSAAIVDTLGIHEASGTVLDHLYVISQAAARARLGIA